MPYATQADLETRFGTKELVKLTDRGTPATGAVDALVVTRAIADAEAEINGYLAARYSLPLATVPTVLARIACDIARYYLYDDWESEPVRNRYKDAVALLKGIAKGEVSLGIDADTQSPVRPTGTVMAEAAARVFSRESMRDY